jgi:hypothetical protein
MTRKRFIISLASLIALTCSHAQEAPKNMKLFLLIGEVIPGHGNHDAVNVALAETAKKTPNAALVSSADLGNKQLHYNSADYRALGKRYAEVFLKMGKK